MKLIKVENFAGDSLQTILWHPDYCIGYEKKTPSGIDIYTIEHNGSDSLTYHVPESSVIAILKAQGHNYKDTPIGERAGTGGTELIYADDEITPILDAMKNPKPINKEVSTGQLTS